MRKIMIFGISMLVLTGLVSAKFITVDPKTGKKMEKTDKINSVRSEQTSELEKDFVSIYGDSLKGALDMAGFGITGLPAPDSSEDAATKGYVDDTLSEVYVSASDSKPRSESSPQTLSEVLVEDNMADQVIRFPKGMMLGDSDTEAVENSIALGNGAEAEQENSVAIGEDSKASQRNLVVLGSLEKPIDLNVTGDTVLEGDLEVKGSLKGYNSSVNRSDDSTAIKWSTTIETDINGTTVNVSHLGVEDRNYQVSATPVNVLTQVAVFDKTRENFTVKARNSTEVDIILKNR